MLYYAKRYRFVFCTIMFSSRCRAKIDFQQLANPQICLQLRRAGASGENHMQAQRSLHFWGPRKPVCTLKRMKENLASIALRRTPAASLIDTKRSDSHAISEEGNSIFKPQVKSPARSHRGKRGMKPASPSNSERIQGVKGTERP